MNGVAVALLLIAIAIVYWFALRPLPQTSGTTRARVRQAATVTRDTIGVAHINAESIADAIYLQGFVTAQDRFWQMDALRRAAAGELSEIVGKAALESDLEARRLRMRRVAEEHARRLPPAERALFSAFTLGVNHYLETHRDRLPLEYALLDYHPKPWTIADSILCGLLMFRTLSTTYKDELLKARMLEAGDPAKVQALFPVRAGQDIQPGSNAWAISGRHTASGRPLLANDTHLEFTIPSAWYLIDLRGGAELHVTGFTLPGLPAVIIGHNDRISWGVTNLHFDVQDLYLEKLDPRNGRYLYRGRPEQARLETESIAVRNGQRVDIAVWVTRHGPVIASEAGKHYALRWTAYEEGVFTYPFIDLNRARNWDEFRAALARFPGAAQNFVYADRDGNIGYQAAGRLPLRKGYQGDVPVDGSGGEFEWDGFIPFDELPRAFNPASGLIVSANQNPFPANFARPVNGSFSSPYRAAQIQALLSKRSDWRAEDMLAVQTDIYSGFLHFIARQAASAYERRKVEEKTLAGSVAVLKNWDGQMRADLAAPLIATLTARYLQRALAERAAPGKGPDYNVQMASAVVERLLRERPPDWFGDWDQVVLRSLIDAVEECRRTQGRSLENWRYGRWLTWRKSHPVLGRLPDVGRLVRPVPWLGEWLTFHIGPVEMSGASTTVKQTSHRISPSMRFVADLSDWKRSLANITVGQSGHLFSPHFRDQWKAFAAGTSFPMQYQDVQARSTLRVEPAP